MKTIVISVGLSALVPFTLGCRPPDEIYYTYEDTDTEGGFGSDDSSPSGGGGGDGGQSSGNGGGGADGGGGEDGGANDGGGASASGGDTAGDEGEPYPPICKFRCLKAEDCNIGGRDIGFTCKDNGQCDLLCEETSECVPVFSGWFSTPCTGTEQCNGGACMNLGNGEGGCAILPSDETPCAVFDTTELMAETIEGASIAVCGDGLVECTENGRCNRPPTDCNIEGCLDGFTCGEDGRCSCASDQACVDADRGNLCAPTGGCVTTCDAADECPTVGLFDGGEAFCEEP